MKGCCIFACLCRFILFAYHPCNVTLYISIQMHLSDVSLQFSTFYVFFLRSPLSSTLIIFKSYFVCLFAPYGSNRTSFQLCCGLHCIQLRWQSSIWLDLIKYCLYRMLYLCFCLHQGHLAALSDSSTLFNRILCKLLCPRMLLPATNKAANINSRPHLLNFLWSWT